MVVIHSHKYFKIPKVLEEILEMSLSALQMKNYYGVLVSVFGLSENVTGSLQQHPQNVIQLVD